ncbi:hypothetical protein ASPZODRAFT_128792 [Penicilliopsis zonata CBS 506.65]|uniref:Uncharacterized protein n=1 Tax=Penicilliopsis zonata CBS 506.65 TaxID=1073090 RepID=A0A1L9SSJ2_9EURO|nr:hypothetical protein ASPZODRAFT_128792 [Penicilliopsis zonata CBS 506.65]OJJ50175.1 hypothetical protein ASPZODRAFT_128792 [Penicilliopsis zonata CBS 506.65]
MPDIASLFGRYGTEHAALSRGKESTDHGWFSPIYKGGSGGGEFVDLQDADSDAVHANASLDSLEKNRPPEKLPFERLLRNYIKDEDWTFKDMRGILRRLRIDLRQDPRYSRLILTEMLPSAVRNFQVALKVAAFLGDPSLNTPGSGNFVALIDHLADLPSTSHARGKLFQAVTSALKVGLIPVEEIHYIVETLPRIPHTDRVPSHKELRSTVRRLRDMWHAIGSCEVLSHKDLSPSTVETWLAQLTAMLPYDQAMLLIGDITTGYPGLNAAGSSWVSALVIQWLDLAAKSDMNDTVIRAIQELLKHENADVTAGHLISTTEQLARSDHSGEYKRRLLDVWQNVIAQMPHTPDLFLSPLWKNVPAVEGLSLQHQITLRLWVLQSFSDHRPTFVMSDLLHLFVSTIDNDKAHHTDLFTFLLRATRDLGLPGNGLLALSVDLMDLLERGTTSDHARDVMRRLESQAASFSEVFMDLHAYNATRAFLFGSFDATVCQMDVTSPDFIEQSVRLAQTGSSTDVWTLIRVLRSHTPLKLALYRSWIPLPHPDDMALVRYHPPFPAPGEHPLSQGWSVPDPHRGLELIHALAVSFATSPHLSPCRAFFLLHQLYRYLVDHGAPLRLVFVRSLYHAAVVRYRRAGLPVALARLRWVYTIVAQVEGKDITMALKEGLMLKPRDA